MVQPNRPILPAALELARQILDDHPDRNPDGCWEWQRDRSARGYGRASLHGISYRVHRLAWAAMHGDPGPLHVLHRCDNPPCYNPAHLFLGTKTVNMADRDAKGRAASGQRNGAARLTDEQAREILRLGLDGMAKRQIARQFGVDPQQVRRIIAGRTWKTATLEVSR